MEKFLKKARAKKIRMLPKCTKRAALIFKHIEESSRVKLDTSTSLTEVLRSNNLFNRAKYYKEKIHESIKELELEEKLMKDFLKIN